MRHPLCSLIIVMLLPWVAVAQEAAGQVTPECIPQGFELVPIQKAPYEPPNLRTYVCCPDEGPGIPLLHMQFRNKYGERLNSACLDFKCWAIGGLKKDYMIIEYTPGNCLDCCSPPTISKYIVYPDLTMKALRASKVVELYLAEYDVWSKTERDTMLSHLAKALLRSDRVVIEESEIEPIGKKQAQAGAAGQPFALTFKAYEESTGKTFLCRVRERHGSVYVSMRGVDKTK